MRCLAIALAALVLSGCAQFRSIYGFDPGELETVNQQVAFGFSQVDELRILTQNLLSADVITADQAQRIKTRLDTAYATLEATRLALEVTGDPVSVAGWLQKTRAALSVALGILNEAAPGVTTASAFEWSESHGTHHDNRQSVAGFAGGGVHVY